MKKFTLISVLAVAALAMLSVSCINRDYDTEDAKVTVDVPVNKTSELPPQTFLGMDDNQAVTPDDNGDLHYGSASETVTSTAEPGQPVSFESDLKVDMTDAPDVIKKSSGGVLTDPAVKLNIANPSSTPMYFSGKLSVDGSTPVLLPSVEIPAEKVVDLLFTPDISSPAEPADLFAPLPADLKSLLEKGMDQGMVLSDVTLTPKEGAKTSGMIKKADAPSQYSVSCQFVSPLSFVSGSVINISQTFSDLGFDLDKYVTGKLEFDVKFSGTNFLPFEVDLNAVSEQSNLTGKLSQKIPAAQGPEGTPFEALFVVKTLSTKTIINDVKLNIELKAMKTPSVLNIKEPFIITAESVKVIK
ncbi:MAG: hypothetical protein J5640_08850 [Bacteroidales bacterium]|nr:hypothetical protein [Bacteroidales bacterium]